jgi:hypothetical protein
MPTGGAFEILKPFLLMAAIAFAVGFFSYLAFTPAEARRDEAWRTTVSGPSSADWNLVKHI